MKPVKTLSILNLLSFLIHFGMSVLSQFKIVSTKDVGEVSDKYPAIFTPAGFTFSIWGLIYILLFIFCIYHIISSYNQTGDEEANVVTKNIGWLFIINNIATAAWLYFWVNEVIIISLVLIIIQLITLIFINIRAHIYDPAKPLTSKICTQIPLSIYFGWISIATIANAASVLKALGWMGNSISEIYWTIIIIGVAALISVFVILVRRNIFYGLVVVWALYGILSKSNSVDPELYKDVITAAWAAIVMVGVLMSIRFYKNLGITTQNQTA